MPDRHTYAELTSHDSFRVLELLPGKRDSALCCKIFEARRRDELEYEAISYTWGAPIFSHSLTEVTSGTVIDITENLHDALQVFRSEDKSRLLWADAVCIDQSSNEEKNHQVRRSLCTDSVCSLLNAISVAVVIVGLLAMLDRFETLPLTILLHSIR
jgi:hypothetical protein